MATLSAHLHINDSDEIAVRAGDGYRWIKIGGVDGLAIHASDKQMVALREAVDAYLARSFAKAEAA